MVVILHVLYHLLLQLVNVTVITARQLSHLLVGPWVAKHTLAAAIHAL